MRVLGATVGISRISPAADNELTRLNDTRFKENWEEALLHEIEAKKSLPKA